MQGHPRAWRIPILPVLWLVCSASAEPNPVPPHRAEYLLTRDGFPFATMVMKLDLPSEGYYRYRSRTRPQRALALASKALAIAPGANVSEESEGRIAEGRLRPDRYLYHRRNDESHDLTIAFDWEKGQARTDSKNVPWSMEIPAATLDKLVVLLALGQDAATGAQDISYPVADGGKLKIYRYRVQGRQEIGTPAGTWEAIEVARTKQNGPLDYRLWLAPNLGYLPVRVEREDNGSLYLMELTSITGIAGPKGETAQ